MYSLETLLVRDTLRIVQDERPEILHANNESSVV